MAATSIANKVKSGSLLVGNPYYVPPVYAYESIATITASGGETTLSLSSIPSTYKHLQIRYIARNQGSSNINDIKMTFNADASANYSKHWGFTFDAGGPYTSTSVSNNFISIGYSYGGDANVYGTGIIDLLDYANGNKNKTVRYTTGNRYISSGTSTIILGSGAWYSGSAINQITFETNGGQTYAAGTKFALYGIKG